MRLRVIDQGRASPLASHAVPYGMARAMAAADEPVLTLCTPDAPYISVGANQDVAREIDQDYCRSRGLSILRREVGGGAVLLDPDQLYFHFVFPRRLAPERAERLFPRFIEPVLRTYADLGIAADYRPLNDVQVDGRKLGASAAAEIGEAVVVAGSFLFDFDRETMAASLKVPSEAFRNVLRQSLADHMTTMRQLLAERPSRGWVKSLFSGHVATTLAVEPVEDAPSAGETAAIDAATARHGDPAWIHRAGRKMVEGGVKIAEGVHLTEGERRTAGGLVRARMLEQDGRIKDLDLTGDITCLPADGLVRLARRLTGFPLDPAPALATEIALAVRVLGLDLPGVTAEDVAETIGASRVVQ